MQLLTLIDIQPFAGNVPIDQLQIMVQDVQSRAALFAPCLASPETLTPDVAGAARAIMRGAVLRWISDLTGTVQTQSAGPMSVTVDSRANRRGIFLESEISELQGLCSATGTVRARMGWLV